MDRDEVGLKMNDYSNMPSFWLRVGLQTGGERAAHVRRRCSALIALVVLLVSLSAGLVPTTIYAQSSSFVAISNITGTTLYSAPGGTQLTTIASGQPLTATGRTADNLWVAVESADGTVGWAAVDELIIFGLARLPVMGEAVISQAVINQPVDSESVDSAPVDSAPVDSAAVASGTVNTEMVDSGSTDSESVANGTVDSESVEGETADDGVVVLGAEVRLSSGRLNVRAAPGTASVILGKVYNGDAVAVSGRDSGGDWLQIQWPRVSTSEIGADGSTTDDGTQIGWVAARYVLVDGAVDTLPVVSTVRTVPTDTEINQPSIPATAATSTVATASETGNGVASGSTTGLSGTLVIQSSPGGMIYGYNLATGALWSIANGFDPAISPDGMTVAFAREGGANGIYLVNIDGSNERLIFSGRTRLSSPKWSPDGNWILFTRSDEYTECVDTGRGGCVSVNALPPDASTADLTLSKDYEYNLAAVDRNGDNYHDIAALESARVADWNDEGIVYQSSAGLQITADSSDAENRLLLFTPLQPPYEDPDWQPNGNQVLFVQHHGSHYEIFTIGSDGTGMTALTRPVTTLVDAMPNNLAPAWSPDGQQIVFLSNRAEGNEAGAWRVWVMDADGSNQRALPLDLTINYTYGNEQVIDWGR